MSPFFPSSFWSKLVPQIAYSEPSIRHALIALSGFHEQFMLRDVSFSSVKFRYGIQQYNLAIRKLLDLHTRQGSPLVSLLCCLLFISIELLQGHIVSAIKLSRSGMAVLFEMRHALGGLSSSSSTRDLYSILLAQYIRLDFQITAMQPAMDPVIHIDAYFDLPVLCPAPVFSLSSISEARQCYKDISLGWVRHAWSVHGDQRRLNVSLFSERIRQWNNAFQYLLNKQGHLFAARDRQGAAMLEVNRRQFEFSLILATMSPDQLPSQSWWDDKTFLLKEVVDYAAVAAGLSEEVDSLSPGFSMDPGINVHLYAVALRCRDPVIRRKAVAVLRSANRHEGLRKSGLIAHVTNKIVMLEEEGLTVRSCHDVPDEARLKDLKINFHPAEMTAEVQYVKKGKVVDEIISWQVSARGHSRACRFRLIPFSRTNNYLETLMVNPYLSEPSIRSSQIEQRYPKIPIAKSAGTIAWYSTVLV